MSSIPPPTLQCRPGRFDVATPTSVAAPPSAEPATPPGISGQTAPPAPVAPASDQKTSLDQLAERAVGAFVAEQDSPTCDPARLEALQNKALRVTKNFLDQQLVPTGRDLSYAYRLAREARWTIEGQAQIADKRAKEAFTALF